jgi:GLPGLI family protein
MRKLLFSFAAAACLVAAMAFMPVPGKSFEGVISYDVSIQSASLPPEVIAMMKGSEMKTYTNGEKSRIELNFAMTQSVTILDHKAKTSVRLIDLMGKKYMIKTKDDDAPKDAPKMEIKYVDGTKVIAGYNCKKAEMTITDKDNVKHTYEVYYTPDLPYYGNFKNGIKGLKGFPMEYSIHSPESDMSMHFTVKSVIKESVSADKFIVPEGYKETTEEEMMKTMMGGGQ